MEVAGAPVPPRVARPAGLLARAPTFCAGCPHNTSTQLPDGSLALAGIGCHIMAVDARRRPAAFCQMGGEGVAGSASRPSPTCRTSSPIWATAPISTPACSRSARRSRPATNITFKILFNDAVAMTGGQPAEGAPNVAQIAAAGRGRGRGPHRRGHRRRRPPAAARRPAARHDAARARRSRRRAARDARAKRASPRSSTTRSARPRSAAVASAARCRRPRSASRSTPPSARIAATAPRRASASRSSRSRPSTAASAASRPPRCNTDLSCLKGFCPSFVTTAGPAATTRAPTRTWAAQEAALLAALPEPPIAVLDHPWRGLFAGIGGGGIVTSGAILAMAAHIEGQRGQHARLHRAGAEERRRRQPRADRARADRHRAHPGGRGRLHAGRRSRGRRLGRRAGALRAARGRGRQSRPAIQPRLPQGPRPAHRRRPAPPGDRARGRSRAPRAGCARARCASGCSGPRKSRTR